MRDNTFAFDVSTQASHHYKIFVQLHLDFFFTFWNTANELLKSIFVIFKKSFNYLIVSELMSKRIIKSYRKMVKMANTAFLLTYDIRCSKHDRMVGIRGSSNSGSYKKNIII